MRSLSVIILLSVSLLAGCTDTPFVDEGTPEPSDDPGTPPEGNEPPADDDAGDDDDADAPPEGNETNTTEGPVVTEWLEVSAFDYTTDTLTGDCTRMSVRIEVVGYGSWEPDFTYCSDGPVVMGEYEAGELHSDAFIVHHGMDAQRCTVSFMVPEEYTDEEIVQVEFYDDRLWIFGEAIVDHPTRELARECPR